MSIIDYGAIAFKNGKLISTEMFTPMKQTVGWKDTKKDVYRAYDCNDNYVYKPLNLKGNHFVYIGDRDCTIAFYKGWMTILEKTDDPDTTNDEYLKSNHLTCYNRKWEDFLYNNYTWIKWEDLLCGKDITVTRRNGYFVCKWKYKGDKYKVYFGYGVDFSSYKKWRIVNYYRCPASIWRDIKYAIKHWIHDICYQIRYTCHKLRNMGH